LWRSAVDGELGLAGREIPEALALRVLALVTQEVAWIWEFLLNKYFKKDGRRSVARSVSGESAPSSAPCAQHLDEVSGKNRLAIPKRRRG